MRRETAVDERLLGAGIFFGAGAEEKGEFAAPAETREADGQGCGGGRGTNGGEKGGEAGLDKGYATAVEEEGECGCYFEAWEAGWRERGWVG